MTAVDLECESVSTSAMRSDASECSTPPASPEASIQQQSNRKRRRGADDDEARKQRLAERKKRNRESAERSRQRKLQYYKDLEISVVDLRKENEELRTKLASHQDLQREVEQLRAQLAAAKSETSSSFPSSPATPASSSTSLASPPASPKAQCSETDHAELAKSIESTLDEVISDLSASVTPTRVSVEPSADDSFVDADILGAILNDDIDMDMNTDNTEHASSTAYVDFGAVVGADDDFLL
ncbi:Transcription factor HY5 [Hondaea fermentalgiana]|uniref:Transcription factor HY5 n=1 Tax=Hondaea fermentalgiana TaxID=2315210 RepID=A0A2R5GQB4_9STRA|nr:Transcription factor HY5 [Hondaea fermentalgiana]|eukprot:GBG33066.1 Transcription factor HY5 [Hondaea fermentalgiana]